MNTQKKTLKTVTITTDEKDPKPLELTAEAIIAISKAAQQLLNSRLNERCIAVLLNDMTNIPMGTIKEVLRSASQLERHFLKSK